MSWEKNWEELEVIGSGGQGIATKLKAIDDSSKYAVLKRIQPNWEGNEQAVDRMRKEIRTLEDLNKLDASVPKVYDSFLNYAESTKPFFIMEYIHGILLSEWIEKHSPASYKESVAIILAISNIIDICHKHDIGHRDIKPANIILKDSDLQNPYVLDFGISFDSQQQNTLTKKGEVFRNEFLTLPENLDQEGGHQSLVSDVTALVGLLFFCLTNEPPILLRNARNLAPHRRGEGQFLRHIEDRYLVEQLTWFFDDGFQQEPGRRIQTLDDLKNRLISMRENTESFVDGKELFARIKQTVHEKDRSVQLNQLRGIYSSFYKTISSGVVNNFTGLGEVGGACSTYNITSRNLGANNGPPGDVGDILVVNDTFDIFGLGLRENFKHQSSLALVAYAVGMQIHLYYSTYIADSNKRNQSGQLVWNKLVVLDDVEKGMPSDKVQYIIKIISEKLLAEAQKLLDIANKLG
ncbi:MAG: protein kinase [Candidatus Pacearchaeota archaeon]|nr:protein kinase [Candidatus Pacearchaeota archaeon]